MAGWFLSPSGWPVYADSDHEQADLTSRGYDPIAETDVQAAVDAYLAADAQPPSSQLPGYALATDVAASLGTKLNASTFSALTTGSGRLADEQLRAAFVHVDVDGNLVLTVDGVDTIVGGGGGGLTSEQVQDLMSTTLVAGANTTITYDDTAGTITIATTGGGAVDSVNGLTGVVVLSAADVGADPAGAAAAVLPAQTGNGGKFLTTDGTAVSWGAGGGAVADATTTTKGVIQLAGDLAGTATAPTVPGLAGKANAADLAPVATSGAYADLTGTPTIPPAYTDEQVRDVMGTALVAGANVTITPDDAGDTIIIAAAAGGGGTTDALTTVAASGADETLTLSGGLGTWDLTLDSPTVALTFAGATAGVANRIRLVARQDATGGREITWPTGVVWRDGIVPALSDGAGAVDVFEFVSVDAGTTWYASRVDAAGLPQNLLTGKGAIITATGPAAPTSIAAGSDGQVLVADSASAAGIKWGTSGGGGGGMVRPMLTGNRYFPTRTITRTAAAISATNGYTYAIPIWLPNITVVNLVVEVTAAGGGTFNRLRLGLWDGPTGVPGTLIDEAGAVDCLTTGVKTAPVGLLVTGGLYWLSATVETDGTAATLSVVNNNDFSEIPSATFTTKSFIHATITTGVLPATFPYTAGDIGSGGCPIIAVDV